MHAKLANNIHTHKFIFDFIRRIVLGFAKKIVNLQAFSGARNVANSPTTNQQLSE